MASGVCMFMGAWEERKESLVLPGGVAEASQRRRHVGGEQKGVQDFPRDKIKTGCTCQYVWGVDRHHTGGRWTDKVEKTWDRTHMAVLCVMSRC